MAIEQLPDGRWRVDVEPIKGKRFRKILKTKAEAQRFEATCRSKLIDTPLWSPQPKDRRRLKDLVALWYALHGQTLSDGSNRQTLLNQLADNLGNPVAAELTGQQYTDYRIRQLDIGMHRKTLNNRLGYLRSVFNELRRLSAIDFDNPLAHVKPLSVQQRDLAYLSMEQIDYLFSYLHEHCRQPHVPIIVALCLATGSRWGEAQALTPDLVRNGMVTFVNTKSKRTRSIPISPELEDKLHDHFKQYGHFTNCLNTFRKRLVASSIKLPTGQASHVLRHTFASHFVMNGGNILTLQKILGHTSITMTMRYAHLAPDHLRDTLIFGPLKDFRHFLDSPDDEIQKSP